jgi:hypothetical protein
VCSLRRRWRTHGVPPTDFADCFSLMQPFAAAHPPNTTVRILAHLRGMALFQLVGTADKTAGSASGP